MAEAGGGVRCENRVVAGRRRAGGAMGLRVRAQLAEPLVRSAYSLAAASVVTAVLGMAFWIVAARIYPSDDVGRDSALIGAMIQLSTVAQLNLANTLIRFMPGRAAAGRMLAGAYAASAVAAVVLATAFVLLAPSVSDELRFLTREPLTGAGYVVAVALWGVFALQDAALTATRHATWVLTKNGLFGVLKVACLPLTLAIGLAHGTFLSWVIPMCVLLVPVNWLLHRRLRQTAPSAAAVDEAQLKGRRLARFLAFDYLAAISIQTSMTMLPLIVIGILGSRANAYFYIPFTIAIALDAMFWSMCTSLVAEGALAPQRLAQLVRLLVRRVAFIVAPLIALLVVAAPLVMLPFGEEYVDESTNVLRLVLLASLFRGAMLLAAAIWRLEGRGARIAALEGCMLLGLLGAAIPLAHAFGVDGVALAWLGSAVAAGCPALPVIARHVRAGRPGEPGVSCAA
jgi:O-antigen/teichoic acid export membrane protein